MFGSLQSSDLNYLRVKDNREKHAGNNQVSLQEHTNKEKKAKKQWGVSHARRKQEQNHTNNQSNFLSIKVYPQPRQSLKLWVWECFIVLHENKLPCVLASLFKKECLKKGKKFISAKCQRVNLCPK